MSKKDNFDLEDFLEKKKESIKVLGFLEEISYWSIKTMIMRSHKREFVRIFFLDSVIPNGEKYILKWEKRFTPLTEEELDKIYKLKND